LPVIQPFPPSLQVCAHGELELLLVKELDVAVLAVPALSAALLTDAAAVKAFLLRVGAPTSVLDAVLSQLPTAQTLVTASGA